MRIPTRRRLQNLGFRSARRPGAALAAAMVAFAVTAVAPPTVLPTTHVASAQDAGDASLDVIVLKSGRVVRGKILSETPTNVRINIIIGGISAPAEYSKTEIVSITRAADAQTESDTGDSATADPMDLIRPRGNQTDDTAVEDFSKPSVYFMPLTGAFGAEIAPQPLERMLDDVRRAEPDFLVVEIDRDWRLGMFTEGIDQQAVSFDEFFTAEQMNDMFLRDMQNWRKRPHIVMWVKNAMGGIAYTPFLGDTIIFHPDGRMGGIGTLEEMFGGTGDHVVRQKQRSLRLGQARGLAIWGGYDPRLVDAMTLRSYELSYRDDGGVAELFEGTPSNPGELLLTEDGTITQNSDTLEQAVRGTGNDVLTIREESAKRLGISLGTAETQDDVLDVLGILRNHRVVDGRADEIMQSWKDELTRLSRRIPKELEDFQNIEGDNPRRVIGQRIRFLEKFKGYHKRYGQSMMFGRDFRPGPGNFLPNEPQINVMIEQARIELMQLDDCVRP
ncbi:MAG: hypothetical protein AAF235_02475 [Planctomycetota bacterium]